MHSLEDFIKALEAKDLSQNTVQAYLSDLKRFAEHLKRLHGEGADTAHAGPLDIANYKRARMKLGHKPSSINRSIRALSAYYRFIGGDNPASGIRPLREPELAPGSLCRKNQLAFMRSVVACGKVRDIAIVTLFMHTGIRVSELCSLKLSDLTMSDRAGSMTIRYGKGDKTRTVPLNATARSAIARWLEERGTGPGHLFYSAHGKPAPMTARAVEYMFERYARDARLNGVTPHTLRHTFCKSLVEGGVSLDRVALLAGHKSLKTTMRYTLANQADLEKAVDTISWE